MSEGSERRDAWNEWMVHPFTKELVAELTEWIENNKEGLRHHVRFEDYCRADGALDATTSILEFIEEMQKE